MSTNDEQVGRNVRAFREARGMSQAEVAEVLTGLGVPGFHPQTVLKVEKGTRSLKFIEGLKLASILGVQPDALFTPPPNAHNDLRLLSRVKQLHREYGKCVENLAYLRLARDRVALALQDPAPSESIRKDAEHALETLTAEAAVETALAVDDPREWSREIVEGLKIFDVQGGADG